jgi:hypothetical protein
MRSSARRRCAGRWARGWDAASHWRSVMPLTRSITSVSRPSTIFVRSMTRTTLGWSRLVSTWYSPRSASSARIIATGDLERARATADEVASGVDHGHAALPEARDDLVVGADARARHEVVGVERRARWRWEAPAGTRGRGSRPTRTASMAVRERRIAVGGAQLDHAATASSRLSGMRCETSRTRRISRRADMSWRVFSKSALPREHAAPASRRG